MESVRDNVNRARLSALRRCMVVAFLFLVTACGAAPAPSPLTGAAGRELPAAHPLPGCTPDILAPAVIPQTFPADLPLPGGLRLYKAEGVPGYPGSSHLSGYAPTTIASAYRFIRDTLPRAAYVMSYGESEANDMELQFTGGGWQGAYRVTALIECSGVTEWTIILLKR